MVNSDPLITYLATHDAPCPGCWYNLRGIDQPICPECGLELEYQQILHIPEAMNSSGEIHAEKPKRPGSKLCVSVIWVLSICAVLGLVIVIGLFIIIEIMGKPAFHTIAP